MRKTIHLRFSVDVESEDEAWDICDGLEKAALRQNYIGASAWFEGGDSRSGVLVREGEEAPVTEAMRVERSPGQDPTAIGDAEGVLVPSQWGTSED